MEFNFPSVTRICVGKIIYKPLKNYYQMQHPYIHKENTIILTSTIDDYVSPLLT
ncbi:MAG: hypothetical protein BAJALOKI1v1_680007 [Promethearchaeota archaeon]|nr:MAG: hypothetical protein BAJALOKI1v1_680007 [Candidatus Lokiarchaeota archaeon]